MESKDLLKSKLADISDDAMIKLARQLEFWSGEGISEAEMVELTKRLVTTATWRTNQEFKEFQVPKKRFGKTELMIPILTNGCMRWQHSWMPDDTPLVRASENTILNSPSQNSMIDVIRQSLKVGMNHFETARGYGSSEMQMAHAFKILFDSGEVKREDVILQTKIAVGAHGRKGFEDKFAQSWTHFGEIFGYIDLLSFHCISRYDQVEWCLEEWDGSEKKDSSDTVEPVDDTVMAAALEWKKQGKIRHIGFSTHGLAKGILQMIESKKFDYVNLHCHYFGSYHAEGTDDGQGGQGNKLAVKRALELDMGVLQISPLDKAGRVYQPSASVARTIGSKMNPMSFVLLNTWEDLKMHTGTIGLGRPSDLDEVVEAARLYASGDFTEYWAAKGRLDALEEEKLGKEWREKGLLNLPDCLTEPKVKCTHVGHILWCHNMVTAFGMYNTAKLRYVNMKDKWKKGKSMEENAKGMAIGNLGGPYLPNVDYSETLSQHYDPKLALEKMKEVHEWFKKETKFTDDELKARGWDLAYDLTPWPEYCDTNQANVTGVILQNLTKGLLGTGGGPTKSAAVFAQKLRESLQ